MVGKGPGMVFVGWKMEGQWAYSGQKPEGPRLRLYAGSVRSMMASSALVGARASQSREDVD